MRFPVATHCTLFILWFASQNVFAAFDLNLTPGVTPLSHDIYLLHMTIFWICVVIGVLVFGVMFYALFHFQKAKGATAAHFHEHTFLETSWTLIPLLILIVMAIPATLVLIAINKTDHDDLTIKVTGYQWKWRYDYLGQDLHFFSNNATPLAQLQNKAPKTADYLRTVDHPLIVPIHKKIRFLVTSNDVIHSCAVPALGVKRDAIPGFINEAWALINRAGTYYGQCTELCGMNHAYMNIVVKAVPQQEFDHWLMQQKGVAVVAPKTPAQSVIKPAAQPAPAVLPEKNTLETVMAQGEKVYMSTCSACHQPNGQGIPPTFPALKGDTITTGPIGPHINRVLNGKPGTAMQAFRDQLSDEELAAVVTYERNAFGNNTKTRVTPEDIKKEKALPPQG